MSELLFSDSSPNLKVPPDQITKPSAPDWLKEEVQEEKEDKKMNIDVTGSGEELLPVATEASTLPWSRDTLDPVAEPESGESTGSDGHASLRGGASRTESELEFRRREKTVSGASWSEGERAEKMEHLEIEVEELNAMPEKAAGVFAPGIGVMRSASEPNPTRHNSEFWEEENKSFINHQGTLPDGYCHDYPRHYKSSGCEYYSRNKPALQR